MKEMREAAFAAATDVAVIMCLAIAFMVLGWIFGG